MKISRLGHFVRVATAALAGLASEMFVSSPLAHAAWAPAALLALRWIGAELAGATSVGG
ncbi:MAG TPA: hypothetical protein VE261_06150 [Gaiellaceae bacterium]|nr:hypothetical protein [Gaiellaceae bacterium]